MKFKVVMSKDGPEESSVDAEAFEVTHNGHLVFHADAERTRPIAAFVAGGWVAVKPDSGQP